MFDFKSKHLYTFNYNMEDICANTLCGYNLENYFALHCPQCDLETDYSRWYPGRLSVECLRREDDGFEDEALDWTSFYDEWQEWRHQADEDDFDYWPDNSSTVDEDFCFDSEDYPEKAKDLWCEECGFGDHHTEDGHWDGPEETILPFFNVLFGTCVVE